MSGLGLSQVNGRFWHVFASLILMLVSHPAWAYRVGTLRSSVQVRKSSEPGSEVLEEVREGTRLYTADKPANGHYKVKTPSGRIGWIEENSLRFDEAAPPPEASSRQRASANGEKASLELRLLGNLTRASLSNFNTAFNTDTLKDPAGIGLEFAYGMSPDLALLFRFERLSKMVALEITDQSTQYDLTISSTPLMLGASYRLTSGQTWTLGASGYAGLGVGTSFKSAGTGTLAGNSVEYSGSPLAFLGALALDWRASKTISLGVEAGYRILNLSSAAPVVLVNGSASSSSETASQAVNLSGPLVGARISFRL